MASLSHQININILDNTGRGAVFWAVKSDRIDLLKMLLGHKSLTALALNHKDSWGKTPVMRALIENGIEFRVLRELANDPRVDLDTTDKEGRSLEEVAR